MFYRSNCEKLKKIENHVFAGSIPYNITCLGATVFVIWDYINTVELNLIETENNHIINHKVYCKSS